MGNSTGAKRQLCCEYGNGNLNTHVPGSLYEIFPPDKAKTILDRFEFVLAGIQK
jgi:hypothetical protein